MRAAALALLLLVTAAAPVADAKPRCKNGRCRLVEGKPARTYGNGAPMVAVNPFTSAVVVTPPARLGVTAREWSLVLSRSVMTAGPAIVELQNLGEDAHNLRIERLDGSGAHLDVPLAESRERQSAAGVLAAGRYKVYCALPGHNAAGMHATLDVG